MAGIKYLNHVKGYEPSVPPKDGRWIDVVVKSDKYKSNRDVPHAGGIEKCLNDKIQFNAKFDGWFNTKGHRFNLDNLLCWINPAAQEDERALEASGLNAELDKDKQVQGKRT